MNRMDLSQNRVHWIALLIVEVWFLTLINVDTEYTSQAFRAIAVASLAVHSATAQQLLRFNFIISAPL